jgi:hypothetical protein
MVIWSQLANLFAFSVFFGTEEKWSWFFSPTILTCFLYFVSAYFVPESPKYLYLHKGEVESAKEAIRFYQGNHVDVGMF